MVSLWKDVALSPGLQESRFMCGEWSWGDVLQWDCWSEGHVLTLLWRLMASPRSCCVGSRVEQEN